MVPNSERSLEQRYRSGLRGLFARQNSNDEFLYEKFGDEGLKLIADMSRRYGLEVADSLRKSLKGKNDIESVANCLIRIFLNVGAVGEDFFWETLRGEGRITLKITIPARKCPAGIKDPKICLAHTTMEKAVVETLNPELTYRVGKSVLTGDPYCEHIVELKSM